MTCGGSDRIDDLPLVDLRRFVGTMLTEMARLQGGLGEFKAALVAKDAEIVALKDEIARLKGLPPRPKFKIKPSGMEQTTSKPAGKKGRKRGRGSLRDKLVITSEVKLKAKVPPGSRFKGYEDIVV